jgi:F-type H+-transporting ATPase subunit beta
MTLTENEPKLKEGRVVAIAGPVVDIEFPHDGIPEINHAVQMTIEVAGESVVVTAEVAQQLGQGRVRAVCLKPTDGLTRGAVVTNTGAASRCPWAKRCSATSST